MKIYFYINALTAGGAERVIANLASMFAEHNHQVTVITSFAADGKYLTEPSVSRYVLEQVDGTGDFGLRKNIRRIARLRKIIRRGRPDILVSFLAHPNFRAIVSCVGLKTKNLISVRNDPEREYPNLPYRILAKVLFRLADGVVFQTSGAREWFPKAIQNRSRIILNPVMPKFFEVSYTGEPHDIVTVGRLAPQKNHELLIRAFSALADRIEDNLIIYGEGPLREDLEALTRKLHLEGRVFFPGAVVNVADAIKSAKLFVLPSDYEGLPNALMEALALGLPCISTDCPCGGPRELIADGENGVLIPVGSQKALTEKMESLLENEELRNRYGRTAKRMSEAFRPEIIYEAWESLALELLK